MTFQITAGAVDGMVQASDRAERHVSSDGRYGVSNLLNKIQIDQSGKFAWAFSGGEVAPMFSAQLSKNMDALHSSGRPVTRADVEKAIRDCFAPVWASWKPQATGPSPCTIVIACGKTREILRWNLNRPDEVPSVASPCFSGQEFNLSAFLPKYIYSPEITVSELAYLVAHSIRSGHDLDTAMIDGLDIVAYQDTTCRFEFLDSKYYWQEALTFADKLKQVLKHAPPVSEHLKL